MRRRSGLVLWICAASMTLAACGGGSGFVYKGPKPPARKTQPAAVSEAPPPGRAAQAQQAAEAEAEAQAQAQEGPVGDPRVLTPVPRTRTDGTTGPIVVPAPDLGELDEPILPEGTRSPAQIKKDQEAWDKCVVQAAFRESEQIGSVAAPVQATPEELCARKLGMEGRNAVPRSRR